MAPTHILRINRTDLRGKSAEIGQAGERIFDANFAAF